MDDIVVISTHGVEYAIDRPSTNSSLVPDGISPKLLKLTKQISGNFLGRLFQQSLSIGELSDDWKNACVVPSFKAEDKNLLNNYRPIPLTCVI